MNRGPKWSRSDLLRPAGKRITTAGVYAATTTSPSRHMTTTSSESKCNAAYSSCSTRHSSCSPQSEHAPCLSGNVQPHAGHASPSRFTSLAPSFSSIARQSPRKSSAALGNSSSSTRRCVRVPQPLPDPGGHPTRAGIPLSKHRSRRLFISAIDPAMAGTSGNPASSSSASSTLRRSMMGPRLPKDYMSAGARQPRMGSPTHRFVVLGVLALPLLVSRCTVSQLLPERNQ